PSNFLYLFCQTVYIYSKSLNIPSNFNFSFKSRIAVVTGGNRGIGLEICRQLASKGVEVILTSRNQIRGEEAVEKLKLSGLSNIVFHQLDISDPSSIASLAKFVQTRFGKLDILINNAGDSGLIIHEDEFRAGGGFLQVRDDNPHLVTNILEEPYEVGEKCVKTNYYATKMVTESLIPLLQLSKSPRIVNLTSFFGDLYWFHNEKLKEELQDIDNLTVKRIDEIVEWFLSDFKAGKVQENGWPLTLSSYKVSKAALNAYTRLMAKKYENILVNCVHPGYVITDMTSQTGMITVEEGAKGPVMAALLPENGPSGVYFNETQIAPFSSTGLKTNKSSV
ncbi:(+)-neomenthol dehydrogenase-like, partial [Bidens hawaiensis]|uniref:(+)-neomenthol dehydrogenase-like n=1 Tax=Bidens hawaiensis TaxID=980011 RepID=UPI00404A7A1F